MSERQQACAQASRRAQGYDNESSRCDRVGVSVTWCGHQNRNCTIVGQATLCKVSLYSCQARREYLADQHRHFLLRVLLCASAVGFRYWLLLLTLLYRVFC
jgi:hypothetical protein